MRNFLICLLLIVLSYHFVAAQDEPRPLYTVPANNVPVFSSGSMAFLGDTTLVMANMLTNTVTVFDTAAADVRVEVPVGRDPRTVAVTPDRRVLVVNRGEGSLSIIDPQAGSVTATYAVGILPYGVVTNNNASAYVSLQGTQEVIALDLATGAILARIPTPAYPTGLALWGDFLYVTHFWSGELSLIYLPTSQVVRTISTHPNAALSASIEIDPRNGIAYLPQTLLNDDVPNAPFDALALPVVQVVELSSLQVLRERRLDLKVIDRPVSLPFAAKLNPDRTRLYIANAGSNDVTVINLRDNTSAGFFAVGANPRGILVGRNNANVYVQNAVDTTLSIALVQFLRVDDTPPTTLQIVAANTVIGAQLFHSSADPRLSSSNASNCAVCHFDGLPDGRVWSGFNTPPLFGLNNAVPPYDWLGTWDSLNALDFHLQTLQAGTGLGANSLELDALAGYLRQLATPPNPFPRDSAEVQRGATVFTELQCNVCHAGGTGSDGQIYDVGTGGRFATPPLQQLWLSAPYLHNGTAPDLEALFLRGQGTHRLPTHISDTDLQALVAYLLSRE